MPGGAHNTDAQIINCHFGIELDGIVVAFFKEADGLTVYREVVEYQEGGENTMTHKLLGPTRWSNIVLRMGLTDNEEFWKWMKKTIDGQEIERKNGAVISYSQDGQTPLKRWDFKGGWVCRYEGPRTNSLENM